MFEQIVVGYDGGQAGRDAVCFAGLLGDALDSHLTIGFRYVPLLMAATADNVEQRVRDEATALLASFEHLPTPDYRWSPSQWPIHALHELASYAGAQLIVFGAAREGMPANAHVSLMERMVHAAPCAVAAIPAGYAERETHALRRLGVGFTDSAEGRAALRAAHQLAELVNGELRVLSGCGLDPALNGDTSSLLPEIDRELEAETEAKLSVALDQLGGGARPSAEVFRGEPAAVLAARSKELDLFLLGSRAYGPLRHALLGSVSAAVMRRAQCPVLVVPRGTPVADSG